MIMTDPYRLHHNVIKPGHLPEPLEPVSTRDPQSAVDRCLNCTAEQCFGTCGPYEGVRERTSERPEEDPADRQKWQRAIDAKVKTMLAAGYGNYPICRELQITEKELRQAKARIYYYRKKNREAG